MGKCNLAIKASTVLFIKIFLFIMACVLLSTFLSGCSLFPKKDSTSSKVTESQANADNINRKTTKKEQSSKSSKDKKGKEQPKGIIGIIINIPKDFFNNLNAVFTEDRYKLPFFVTAFVLLIKFVANHAVVALDFKQAFAEMPCEISILSMGFKTTEILASSKAAIMDYVLELISLFIAFIIIACFARSLITAINKNSFLKRHWFFGFLSYIIAIWSFSVSITSVI